MYKLKWSNYKLIEIIFYISIFFPYLTFFTRKIDTSPYSLIIATFVIIIALIKKAKVPKYIFVLFLLFLFSFLLLSTSTINFSVIRIVAGYYSVFVIAWATYYIIKINNYNIKEKLMYNFILIWFFVGIVQTVFYPDFMTFLLDRVNTGFGRGVVSLSPEPTYYGTVAIFLFLISFILDYKVKETAIITFIIVTFLSKSSTAFMILLFISILYFFLFLLNKKNIFLVFLFILSFIILFNIGVLDNTRLHYLILKAIDDPINMFVKDASVNVRVWFVLGSFIESYNNYFLPNGYNTFAEKFTILLDNNSNYVNDYIYMYVSNKIMSGTGQMLYDLGFFSFVYVALMFHLANNVFKSLKKSFFLTVSFFITLSSTIPLVLPFIGFIYGLLIVKYNKKGFNKSYD